jgi:hypothetical protein
MEAADAGEAAACGAGGVVDGQRWGGGFSGHRSRRRNLVVAAGEEASRGAGCGGWLQRWNRGSARGPGGVAAVAERTRGQGRAAASRTRVGGGGRRPAGRAWVKEGGGRAMVEAMSLPGRGGSGWHSVSYLS